MADPVDVVARGRTTDLVTEYLFQSLGAAPGVVVLTGFHFETLGVRALRADATGRLFVNPGTSAFQVVNLALADAAQNIIVGAPIFRRITFYAFNANASLVFQLTDLTLTAALTVVPNVPLIVEGIFIGANAARATAGVAANLQAVIGSDPLQGA